MGDLDLFRRAETNWIELEKKYSTDQRGQYLAVTAEGKRVVGSSYEEALAKLYDAYPQTKQPYIRAIGFPLFVPRKKGGRYK